MTQKEFEALYENNWSEWKKFPNPDKKEYLFAPFGPGVYQLRHSSFDHDCPEEFILFGSGKNVAFRMSSLLPKPKGEGTRKNKEKREYILENIDRIEYRTIAFEHKEESRVFEKYVKGKESYIFST